MKSPSAGQATESAPDLEAAITAALHAANQLALTACLAEIDLLEKAPPSLSDAPIRHALIHQLKKLCQKRDAYAQTNAPVDENLNAKAESIVSLLYPGLDLTAKQEMLSRIHKDNERRLSIALEDRNFPSTIIIQLVDFFREKYKRRPIGRPRDLDSSIVAVLDYSHTERLNGRPVGPSKLAQKFCRCTKSTHGVDCQDVLRHKLTELKKNLAELEIDIDQPIHS